MNRLAARVRGGRPAGVGLGAQVTVPPAPISTAAVAISPVPLTPGMLAMPSCVRVAAIDSMSGIGVVPIVTKNVLTPGNEGAGLLLVQRKTRAMSCEKAADAVMENTKLCVAPCAISTGTSGKPIGMFWASVRQ